MKALLAATLRQINLHLYYMHNLHIIERLVCASIFLLYGIINLASHVLKAAPDEVVVL